MDLRSGCSYWLQRNGVLADYPPLDRPAECEVAVLGGGIGTGIAAGTKGKEVVIPAGTDLAITLDEPLTIAQRE